MLNPDAITTEREIWAVVDNASSSPGDGGKSNPWRISGNLDSIVPRLGPSCRLHLGPGEYLTRGITVPKVFILDGLGATIKLRDNSTDGLNFPHIRVLTDSGQWCSFFSVSDIIVDGNWDGQPAIFNGTNGKIEPICVQTLQGRVSSCTVRNFGSVGAPGYYLEAFPLSLTTLASGDIEFYDLRYTALYLQELSPSRIEILDSVVELPHFKNGGYATAIFVRTALGSASGDRQPFGTRKSLAALVRGNRVNTPGGICYGAGGTKENGGTKGDWGVEMANFEDNYGTGKTALNIDTGRLFKVRIVNNRFINVAQGPNITPDVAGNDLDISGNVIQLGAPFAQESQWAIKTERVTHGRASRNTILVPRNYAGEILIGIDGQDNTVGFPSVPTVPDDSTTLAEANAKISILTSQLTTTQNQFVDVNKMVDGLKAQLLTAQAQIVGANNRVASLILDVSTERANLVMKNQENARLSSAITDAKAALNRA